MLDVKGSVDSRKRVRRERRAAFLKVLESRGLFAREGFALSCVVE